MENLSANEMEKKNVKSQCDERRISKNTYHVHFIDFGLQANQGLSLSMDQLQAKAVKLLQEGLIGQFFFSN